MSPATIAKATGAPGRRAGEIEAPTSPLAGAWRWVRAHRGLATCLVVGAMVRLVLLRDPGVWYDEATVGLLGLRVLRGDLPVYFFGQPYMGALDGYLAAPLYAVLGPSIVALKLLPVVLSIVWLVLVVRLGWLAGGERAAGFTAALLVVPPDFLLYWSHQARTHYPLGMVLGTLALVLAARGADVSGPRARLVFAVLGLVAGLAFWTTFLTVVFLPAVAVLAAQRGPGRLLGGTALALPTFCLGGLPHWLYAIPHGAALPSPGPPIEVSDLAAHVRVVGRVSWPIIAGVPAHLHRSGAGIAIALALAVLYAVTAGVAVRGAAGRGAGARPLVWALLALVLANLAAAVGTEFGRRLDDPDQKYLLPLYAALPVLVGCGLASLGGRLALTGGLGLLLVQAVGATEGSLGALVPSRVSHLDREAQRWRRAGDGLAREGPRRVYTNDPTMRVLTFVSAERVIASNSYEEILPSYARAVDGDPAAGWWSGEPSSVLETNFHALGAEAARRLIPGRGVVYADFRLSGVAVEALDPARFTVSASENDTAARRIVDRDVETLWGTARPKRGGEWIEVDLGAIEPVALVRWLPGTYQEVPSGLRLESSVDGTRWQVRVDLPQYIGPLYWSAGHPIARIRGGRVEVRLPPTPARYLRITQLGQDPIWHWTIRELLVYRAQGGPAPASGPDGPELARALRAAGIGRLYADHGWASQVVLADPGIQVPPANRYLDPYGLQDSARNLYPPFDWRPGTGALVEGGDVAAFGTTLEADGLGFTTRSLGALTLFRYAPPLAAVGPAVPARSLRLTASPHPKAARLAVDGRPETRWSTGRPQAPGDWLRIDLPAPRRLAAVRLWSASPTDAPRDLAVEGSRDGVTWHRLGAEIRRERTLRWIGIGALRAGDGVDAVDVAFPPAEIAALRLTLTRGDPVYDWSVHELTVYEAR
jgi:F5/8 type C domain